MAVYIPLTRGARAIVDDADAALVLRYRWQLWTGKNGDRYAVTHIREGDRRRFLSMHRLIMGEPVGMLVDHMDRDGLNNRRSTNLRIATRGQNRANSAKSSAASSKWKGVYRFEGKWRAQITAAALGSKQPEYLGTFSTEVDAARAYDAAASAVFGNHARLNFPAELRAA